MRLQDRVIVVTGGSQGIGEALARRYAREGAAVAILNRDPARGGAVAESIVADGGRAVAIACDVSDVDALPAAVDAVHDALGPVDVLVNNAGFRANNADYRRRADERFGGPGVWMQADELTGAAVFLASEDADSVTGATLYVNRGWSAY